ncbi:jg7232 [Pararge aegeria aegeria]|uniref:Jg7232 protein n=1 Tax=Pararge aegeria aegeria TaxID=348720 RepID=A0A8S4S5I4_9NEOP|nr:jg7232 [Pararge aegeria aegeria]
MFINDANLFLSIKVLLSTIRGTADGSRSDCPLRSPPVVSAPWAASRTVPFSITSAMKHAALFALLVVALASDPTSVDHIRNKFYDLEDKLWRNVTNPEWSSGSLGGDVELTKAFVKFDEQIEALPRPPRPPFDTWLWLKFVEKSQIIEGYYKNFVEFARRQAVPGSVPAPVREWLDLAEGVLMDPKASVAQSVRKIHDLLEHGDLFRSMMQEEHPDLCELQLSPHQLIYDMYNTISLTEIKGYAMMQFSWMLLRIYGKGNFTQEASLTRQRYGERTSRTAAAARAALAIARRDLYRCDPPEHKIAIADTNGSNMKTVEHWEKPAVAHVVRQRSIPGGVGYSGTVPIACASATNPDPCHTVISAFGPPHQTSKTTSQSLGLWDTRTHLIKGSYVDSWWKWNLLHCSYCMCLCEDDIGSSERTFSLREVIADITNNKVVTGLRLVKHGRVFHLQISEGTLGERGSITPGSWVPLQKFDISDPGIRDGEDYHTLSYEKRAIDLDELDSPTGYILTGVRFRMIGAHLHFEIRSTPFNYTTGRLAPDRSQWISNDNTEGADVPRSRLELIRPDIPTRSATPLPVDSKHDQYVEFTHSDFDADAAQSTVPFIDIQPLEPIKDISRIVTLRAHTTQKTDTLKLVIRFDSVHFELSKSAGSFR